MRRSGSSEGIEGLLVVGDGAIEEEEKARAGQKTAKSI